MLTYVELKNEPKKFLALTSLTVEEFDHLLPAFEACYQAAYPPHLTKTGQPRQRQAGGGRKPRLTTRADQLLFVLVYEKTYPLQSALGALFGYTQPHTNELIHTWTPLLRQALEQLGFSAGRDATALGDTPHQLFQMDGTERRQFRPQDPEKQADVYSGKAHAPTLKNLIVIETTTERVVYLSPTVGGAVHDKKLADQCALDFPPLSCLTKDRGFQGYAPDGVHCIQPKKCKRGGWLSYVDLTANRLIARDRIVVEHIIARIKRCRIVKDVWRNTKAGFSDVVIDIACGLHNLRTTFRKPATPNAAVYFR